MSMKLYRSAKLISPLVLTDCRKVKSPGMEGFNAGEKPLVKEAMKRSSRGELQ